MPHRTPRRILVVSGTARWTLRSRPPIGRSARGITHGGVRCSTVSRPTFGWIAGTIWMAEAPVPTMATRLPVRS